METTSSPYLLDLQFRGFIEGLTIKQKSQERILCQYFGGIPYALPPVGPFRWQKPRPLEPCYRYGTRGNPGRYTGVASMCPQPGAQNPLFDEDCLQCNIWLPEGQAPEHGWPVYFYIHGGFLQFGNANTPGDPTALLSQTPFKAIIVKPAYRLNIFGFLASKEILPNNTSKIVANLGFWDLRLALEWTYKNISYFSGDPTNITVGGYSAGAHATFYQLAYDLDQPPLKRLIKRIIMHSNGPGVPPKTFEEAQQQFNELLSILSIPLTLSSEKQMMMLRKKSSKELISTIPRMKLHQFRAVLDGDFIKPFLFPSLHNGLFARKLLSQNTRIMIGDCASEHHIYALHRPLPSFTLPSLTQRFTADYPPHIVRSLLRHYSPAGQIPKKSTTWNDAFGKIYADVQIYATLRGFVNDLYKHGAGHIIHRYHIDWRSETAQTPSKFGATHSADMPIWFFGDGKRLPVDEEEIIREGFIESLAKFVQGERLENWENMKPDEVRKLKKDGTVETWKDDRWNEGVKVWRTIMEASNIGFVEEKAKL